ncbi:MAG TPA: hypothetical protein VIS76_09865, partial [Pseudomonadales bacterium]
FIDDCTKIMSAADVPRYGDACRITLKERLQRLAMRMVPRLNSMAPGYTPHRYEVPAQVERLSARFSAQAESAS